MKKVSFHVLFNYSVWYQWVVLTFTKQVVVLTFTTQMIVSPFTQIGGSADHYQIGW